MPGGLRSDLPLLVALVRTQVRFRVDEQLLLPRLRSEAGRQVARVLLGGAPTEAIVAEKAAAIRQLVGVGSGNWRQWSLWQVSPLPSRGGRLC